MKILYDRYQLYMGEMNGLVKTEKIEQIPQKAIFFKKSDKMTKLSSMVDDEKEEENSSRIIRSILKD